MTDHTLAVKVYLEDPDAQGIVYHANYLKYCERARTDILDHLGFQLGDMQDKGFTFVVHEMHLRFKRPAKLHDTLEVRSTMERASEFRMAFKQKVYKPDEKPPLFIADVNVVAIGHDGKLRELPDEMFE